MHKAFKKASGDGGRCPRAVVLVAMAILLGSAPVNSSYAGSPIHTGNSQPTFSFIPLDVGLAAGIFRKYGLEIDKHVFNGSAQMHQGIAAGAIDIGLGAGPELAFLAKGAPEIAVAAMADEPADLAVAVLKDGPIKTVADLKGRRVSMSTKGSLTEWVGRELSRQQGWGMDGINLTPLGSFAAQTAALKTGQIDGMIVEAGTAGRLEEEGSGRTLLRFGEIIKDFHIHVIYAHNDFVQKRGEDLRGFLAAWFESVRYMRDHRDESVKVASQVLSISPALSAKLFDELMPMYNLTGKFSDKALDVIAQGSVDMGEFKAKPDMRSLLTEKYLLDTK
jgi:NitT/TauT family transport system substrate-binding protein